MTTAVTTTPSIFSSLEEAFNRGRQSAMDENTSWYHQGRSQGFADGWQAGAASIAHVAAVERRFWFESGAASSQSISETSTVSDTSTSTSSSSTTSFIEKMDVGTDPCFVTDKVKTTDVGTSTCITTVSVATSTVSRTTTTVSVGTSTVSVGKSVSTAPISRSLISTTSSTSTPTPSVSTPSVSTTSVSTTSTSVASSSVTTPSPSSQKKTDDDGWTVVKGGPSSHVVPITPPKVVSLLQADQTKRKEEERQERSSKAKTLTTVPIKKVKPATKRGGGESGDGKVDVKMTFQKVSEMSNSQLEEYANKGDDLDNLAMVNKEMVRRNLLSPPSSSSSSSLVISKPQKAIPITTLQPKKPIDKTKLHTLFVELCQQVEQKQQKLELVELSQQVDQEQQKLEMVELSQQNPLPIKDQGRDQQDQSHVHIDKTVVTNKIHEMMDKISSYFNDQPNKGEEESLLDAQKIFDDLRSLPISLFKAPSPFTQSSSSTTSTEVDAGFVFWMNNQKFIFDIKFTYDMEDDNDLFKNNIPENVTKLYEEIDMPLVESDDKGMMEAIHLLDAVERVNSNVSLITFLRWSLFHLGYLKGCAKTAKADEVVRQVYREKLFYLLCMIHNGHFWSLLFASRYNATLACSAFTDGIPNILKMLEKKIKEGEKLSSFTLTFIKRMRQKTFLCDLPVLEAAQLISAMVLLNSPYCSMSMFCEFEIRDLLFNAWPEDVSGDSDHDLKDFEKSSMASYGLGASSLELAIQGLSRMDHSRRALKDLFPSLCDLYDEFTFSCSSSTFTVDTSFFQELFTAKINKMKASGMLDLATTSDHNNKNKTTSDDLSVSTTPTLSLMEKKHLYLISDPPKICMVLKNEKVFKGSKMTQENPDNTTFEEYAKIVEMRLFSVVYSVCGDIFSRSKSSSSSSSSGNISPTETNTAYLLSLAFVEANKTYDLKSSPQMIGKKLEPFIASVLTRSTSDNSFSSFLHVVDSKEARDKRIQACAASLANSLFLFSK